MENNSKSVEDAGKQTLKIYLDLNKSSYRNFIENQNITAGELVERILFKYVEQGYIKEKRKEFSLYLINTKQVDKLQQINKNKNLLNLEGDNSLENTIDSAYKFPTVVKRKLHHKERPIIILNRTNLK